MNIKEILDNIDYSGQVNSNKELVNGSFNEGYKGWIIPNPEKIKILSENEINFLRIQNDPSFEAVFQIIEGLEPNVKYKLTGKARLSKWKIYDGSLAIFGLHNDTLGPATFVTDTQYFKTGTVELSADAEGLLRVFLIKTQVEDISAVTADFTGFIFEKA
ncbi:hypothetical protein [Photorhabdus luminescens]|uniref:CBM-cenC domain-containing protein n=1 Tax=Photorhabdus luminescens subsp. sonorensis TaxID=1173677 RepID=A0A5C4RDP1_PHOLU|nr:hypothetical protein [Photorhabdus luminescens]TNH42203.1 hypothetical protein EP164_18310 [Photorhabdus luminescens subsp. sonorensis]